VAPWGERAVRLSISEFRKFPILEQQRIAEKSLANASRKAELEAKCERRRRERYGPKVA
jgi:hypothetical protein